MPNTGRFGIFPAQFVTGGTTLTLRQLSSVAWNPGKNIDSITAHGAVDPSAHVLASASPRFNLSTQDIETVLAVVSPTIGFPVTSSFMMQYQGRANGAVFTGSGTHEKLSGTKGFLSMGSLGAQQGGGADLALNFYPLYDIDSETDPRTPPVVQSQVSLTSSPTFTSKYYFGPIYHNGSLVEGCTSVQINFGIDYRPIAQNGEIWPSRGAIYNRNPSITLGMTDLATARAFGNLFNNSLAGVLACYFAKHAAGGHRVATSASSNLKVSCATGVISVDSIDGSGNEDAPATITILPTGTMSTATNSAIP